MKIKRLTNRISPNLTRKQKALQLIAKDAHKKFVEETPVRSGNARRNTTLTQTASKSSINANYDYAKKLDQGSSKQAPDGMSDPTIDFIKQQVRKTL